MLARVIATGYEIILITCLIFTIDNPLFDDWIGKAMYFAMLACYSVAMCGGLLLPVMSCHIIFFFDFFYFFFIFFFLKLCYPKTL